jgi:hypothetical protein
MRPASTTSRRIAPLAAVALAAAIAFLPMARSHAVGSDSIQIWQNAFGWWDNGNVDYFGLQLSPAGSPCGAAGTCDGFADSNRPLDWAIWGSVRNACNTGNPEMNASLKHANGTATYTITPNLSKTSATITGTAISCGASHPFTFTATLKATGPLTAGGGCTSVYRQAGAGSGTFRWVDTGVTTNLGTPSIYSDMEDVICL